MKGIADIARRRRHRGDLARHLFSCCSASSSEYREQFVGLGLNDFELLGSNNAAVSQHLQPKHRFVGLFDDHANLGCELRSGSRSSSSSVIGCHTRSGSQKLLKDDISFTRSRECLRHSDDSQCERLSSGPQLVVLVYAHLAKPQCFKFLHAIISASDLPPMTAMSAMSAMSAVTAIFRVTLSRP